MDKLTQTPVGRAFSISLGLTLLVYILRGFGLLSMMPGFILLVLIAISLILGIVLSIMR